MHHEQSNLLNMKEQEILQLAIEKLMLLTGVVIRELELNAKEAGRDYDGVIEICTAKNRVSFVVEIKNELRNNRYFATIQKKHKAGENYLLVGQYIPKPLKQELKNANHNYLDAAGNCFIQTPELFIYINDQQVTATRLPAEGKLWKTAGLKFLFAILQQPEILNFPYRRIADEAGVSL